MRRRKHRVATASSERLGHASAESDRDVVATWCSATIVCTLRMWQRARNVPAVLALGVIGDARGGSVLFLIP